MVALKREYGPPRVQAHNGADPTKLYQQEETKHRSLRYELHCPGRWFALAQEIR